MRSRLNDQQVRSKLSCRPHTQRPEREGVSRSIQSIHWRNKASSGGRVLDHRPDDQTRGTNQIDGRTKWSSKREIDICRSVVPLPGREDSASESSGGHRAAN